MRSRNSSLETAMQPKTHVVDGVTFVATPYRA